MVTCHLWLVFLATYASLLGTISSQGELETDR